MRVAARRIAWGKFLNAGQSCAAPDHVLVHASRERELLAELRAAVRRFYGEDPRQSPDYGRIIHGLAFERLVELLAGGTPVIGGAWDSASRYFAPTVLSGVSRDSRIMREEIFGPILPVLPVSDLDEAIALVNGQEKPLALYLFTQDGRSRRRVLSETSSGAFCVNEVVTHFAVPGLPFGGVGESGLGSCHGRYSFEAFTHSKALFERGTRFDPAVRYPPWGERKARWLRRLI
ncbi:MAG: aldehyde dehydrogenase family protein [Planctomycetes bacterium]|nr:aldehyde dehydrogenase family protein [Planctomycetota bacterium]